MPSDAMPQFTMRRDLDGFPDALVHSLFRSADYGLVLTGPNREVVAVNRLFAEMFDVDADRIFGAQTALEIRNLVAHRFADASAYETATEPLYDEQQAVANEEIQLKEPARSVRRSSVPVVRESDGKVLGRLWSFWDTTEERRLERMREAVNRVSLYNDPDPSCVTDFIAETVGEFYGANGVVSILRDDFLEFRSVGGKSGPVQASVGWPLDQSCCRIPIEEMRPEIIPDTLADVRCRDTAAARSGVRTYLGVPLFSAQGTVRGTLALMSDLRSEPLDDEDVRFLTSLAMRVSSELERERLVAAELAARQSVVDEQASDLAATREVLDAMVHAFDLVSFDEPIETVLVAQAALLENLLGFGTVAIVALSGSEERPILATPYGHRQIATTEAIASVGRTSWLRRDALRQLGLDGFAEALAVPLGSDRRSFGFLVYEAERRIDLDDHRRIHLEAIAEQVALTLEAYTLRAELLETGRHASSREADAVLAGRLAASGLLAATVAHDVKNIVAAISLELASTSEPLRALAAVRTHLDRFAVLSHRLLSYSKPRMVVKRPVDLDELIRRVAGLFQDHLRISDIQLVFSPAKMPTIVLGDPHQLEHLFANLILNAIQAMSARSGGLIEIRAKRSGRRAVIEVRDTGPGLPEENLDKMFEPFVGFRHEGFGLGLFAVRRIANEHGGDVKVASTPGVGTTFTITLQAAPTEP